MLHTHCVICKRQLTNHDSQLIGMGKICAAKTIFKQTSLFMNESNLQDMLKNCAHTKSTLEYRPPHAGIMAKCELRTIFKNGKRIVIFSELPDNPGMSVITGAEYVVKKYKEENPEEIETIFIEHSATQQGDDFSIINKEGQQRFTYLSPTDFLKLIQ